MPVRGPVAIAAALVLAACGGRGGDEPVKDDPTSPAASLVMRPGLLVIAHRGASAAAPEKPAWGSRGRCFVGNTTSRPGSNLASPTT